MPEFPPDTEERAERPQPPSRTSKQPQPELPVKIQQGLPTYQDEGPLQDQIGRPHTANRRD